MRYQIITGWNIFLLLIAVLAGFICAQVSNIPVSRPRAQTPEEQLIQILSDWRDKDTQK